MIENCTAVILAGGESRRMGQDKAEVIFRGETLLDCAIANLEPLFANIVVSVRQPRQDFPLPCLCDESGSLGPMCGIATALAHVETDWVFAIACDMPFISPVLVRAMAKRRADHDMVLAMVDGYLQPLAAFYAKSCLPQMQQQLAGDHRSLKTLVGNVNALTMQEQECAQYDAELLSFFDLDTRTDLACAETILQENE